MLRQKLQQEEQEQQEQQKRQEEAVITQISDEPEFPEEKEKIGYTRDLEMDEIDAFWDDFFSKDYDGQVSFFLEKLDDEQELDDDVAFDMLDYIHQKTIKRKAWENFGELLSTFERKHGESYKKSCNFYLKWQI